MSFSTIIIGRLARFLSQNITSKKNKNHAIGHISFYFCHLFQQTVMLMEQQQKKEKEKKSPKNISFDRIPQFFSFLIRWSVIIDNFSYSTLFNISNIWIDKNSTEVKIMIKNGELRYDTLIYFIWWIITLLRYWMYPNWPSPYWSIY